MHSFLGDATTAQKKWGNKLAAAAPAAQKQEQRRSFPHQNQLASEISDRAVLVQESLWVRTLQALWGQNSRQQPGLHWASPLSAKLCHMTSHRNKQKSKTESPPNQDSLFIYELFIYELALKGDRYGESNEVWSLYKKSSFKKSSHIFDTQVFKNFICNSWMRKKVYLIIK